ncbi:MAG: sigma-54 dependent transcriptional regulator [Methylococcales bacterium]
MKHADVLIVEDDLSLREALTDTLEIAGYRVAAADNGHEALELMSRQRFRLVVSDVQMQRMDGLTLLQHIQSAGYDVPVLLMTAYGTIEKAVKAIQTGAVDYLIKPFEVDVLLDLVSRHISQRPTDNSEEIFKDDKMERLYSLAARVAKTNATVLIQGDSGTGKEVIARYLHQQSPRQNQPFIAINCAAIPDNMLEAVLFGYEKGAFTGAYQSTPGKFEQAQGGTLLLDEITEMDIGLQAKLLRVLQEREVERLGGRRVISLDVRVLATTNRNLKEQVEEGEFREDLFYRLNVFPLKIPPLKERRADILPLAKAMLQRHWDGGKTLPHFDLKAEQYLLNHPWPGNVRELENVIQRALILNLGETIGMDELVLDFDDYSTVSNAELAEVEISPDNLGKGLRSVEEKIILDTLKEESGSRKSTADRLGISPRTLRYKIARMREAGVTMPC